MWAKNPIKTNPIAHGIWDPHFGITISDAYLSNNYSVIVSYSGIYSWLYTVGFNNVFQIYNFVTMDELLAVISIILAKLHLAYLDSKLQWLSLAKSSLFIWLFKMVVSYFDLGKFRLNFHIGVLIGFICVVWSGLNKISLG